MDFINPPIGFRCVWLCVEATIHGLPIKLTRWGEIFRHVADAFNNPASADVSSIAGRATLGCMMVCNVTMVLQLSESLRSWEAFGAATPSGGPVVFCCDLQGICMPCDWA
ncbi:hypothetical protein N0V84_003394 [Fusarium piperis]|uniref:Uncharacterized protein n=1 Tax=Fusarium piperis TaxID=1435070 RepID=A0A9W8WHH4_9HYPO|nr:hypothetical protein N0V84_003394 [Fusarium piperis]